MLSWPSVKNIPCLVVVGTSMTLDKVAVAQVRNRRGASKSKAHLQEFVDDISCIGGQGRRHKEATRQGLPEGIPWVS